MAKLEIVHYPHPALSQQAEEVTEFDDELRTFVADMAETMYSADGVGLAANQVAVLKRVFVVDVGDRAAGESKPMAFINPEIVRKQGEACWEEGCLSFPGLWVKVKRAGSVVLRAQNEHGETFEVEADEALAVPLQHELDHLDGVTMVDRVGRLSRKLALKRYKRARDEAAAEGSE